jgi:hypothetical protein
MKGVSLIVISFLFFNNCSMDKACKDISPDQNPNGAHNELVTKIHIPEGYKFITGVDTDFIRITILDLDKKNCTEFYKTNKFESINDTFHQTFIDMDYLDSVYTQLPDNNKLLRLSGKNNWTNWIYLLDTTTCRLYGHISFPDWYGHTK